MLGHNYPGSRWYQDSYNQLAEDGAIQGPPVVAGDPDTRPGLLSRIVGSVF